MDIETFEAMRGARKLGRSAWKRNERVARQAGHDVMPYVSVREANAEVHAMVATQER